MIKNSTTSDEYGLTMQANNWLIRHRFGVRVKFARPARETVCGWDEFAYEKWTNLTVIEM